VLAWLSSAAGAQPATEAPRVIRVVVDSNYPPYSFHADDGKLQGIVVDQWQAWEKRTGIKAELSALDLSESVRRMRAGEFDVIDEIVETTERRDYLEFMPAYAAIEVPIFFRSDISGLTDVASLKDFPVGVKKGDQHVDKLRAGGVTNLIQFPNYEALVEAAKQSKINVFVADAPTALYLLHKAGIEAHFRQSTPIFSDELQRAVRKGNEGLLHQVVAGFAGIEPAKLKQIDEKWFGRAINRFDDYLIFMGSAAGVTMLLAACLIWWNRTLRRKVQQRTAALSESEQRFRQIAENIHEVFWLRALDLSKTLYVSPAYETVWGRSCESLYQDPRSFIGAIHQEDRSRAIGAFDDERKRGFDIEYRVVRPDGSIRWIRDRGFPIKDEATRAYCVAGIAEDITDRKLAKDIMKQAEDRVRLIIDTIPTMVWSVQPDGVVDFLNQRWLEYSGLSIKQHVKEPTSVIHPEDIPKALENWRANMTMGIPSEDEMRLRRADGVFRWFLIRTAPLRDEDGNIVKWIGCSVDIEDRRRAEQMLFDSREQLRALTARLESLREEERTRISREIHDDLGAKLTALKMDLQWLERKLGDSGSQANNAVLDRTVAATELVNDVILTVQRLARELRPDVLDKLGLTAAVQFAAREFSERSRIACTVQVSSEEFSATTDQATALYRILQECLTNVARHSRGTSVSVQLASDRDRLFMRVRDNGLGIEPAVIRDPQSLGIIGMRERVLLLAGRITFGQAPEGGTVVEIWLPNQARALESQNVARANH
jgi:PAS domain S-box-containing protein